MFDTLVAAKISLYFMASILVAECHCVEEQACRPTTGCTVEEQHLVFEDLVHGTTLGQQQTVLCCLMSLDSRKSQGAGKGADLRGPHPAPDHGQLRCVDQEG